MTVNELRESGLLELYVIGDVTAEERAEVERLLDLHPELSAELLEIERALMSYAAAHGSAPSPDLKDAILSQVGGKSSSGNPPKNDTSNRWGLGLGLLVALGALAWAWSNVQKLQHVEAELATLQERCDSLDRIQNAQLALYDELFSEGSTILALSPTPKYPNTALYLYLNDETRKNYVQAINLPQITAQQVFQLWSLKGSDAPIPLSTFTADSGIPQEIDFEDGTDVYAITIEPVGGSQTPNLDELIGTIPVG